MGLIMSDTVLVTGGAGYIGAHACKVLARAGFTPVTFATSATAPAASPRPTRNDESAA